MAEKDYISREAAIETVKKEREYFGKFSYEEERAFVVGFHQGITFALSDISSIPAADVRPVVRGKWMAECFDPDLYGDFEFHTELYTRQSHHACDRPYCSECGGGIFFNGAEEYEPTPYCPNCGAIMEES